MRVSLFTLLSALAGTAVLASPAPVTDLDASGSGLKERAVTVTVDAPAGTIIGREDLFTEKFSGIPYAEPPQRLAQAVRLTRRLENFDATTYAPACPQFVSDASDPSIPADIVATISQAGWFKKAMKVSEDCLNVDIIRPKGTKAGDNLPVLFWIYGGGYELGFNAMYDGTSLVTDAAAAGKPYVFVAVNYRVGAWGFLGGKEIKAAGSANMGSRDQRMGLEFVADNIRAFGGDPDRVTIWGESAGSWSVWNQLAAYDGDNTYNGKPLFRAGIMNSGSLLPVEPVDSAKPQRIYDTVVRNAGCDREADTLACLRALPLDAFTEAANSVGAIFSYTSLSLSYLPRPDGEFMTASPQTLLREKRYARVPFICGHQEDEGTLFSLFGANTSSTTDALTDYYHDVYWPSAPREAVAELVNSYPDSLDAGSPFRTGFFNELYGGFKRTAAILGDFMFSLMRRVVLETHARNYPDAPMWSYTSSYAYGTPVLGSFHASDLIQVFFGLAPNYAQDNIRKYYANFVYNLDPNDDSGGSGKGSSKVPNFWPRWDPNGRKLLNFYKLFFKEIKDDFRQESYDVLNKNLDLYLN